MKWIVTFLMVITLLGCGKKDENKVNLMLKGEIPEKGQVKVMVYGYDKMLADYKATLVVIHREELTKDKTITFELLEDIDSYIKPPVKGEDASYYINIEIEDGKDLYTQDYEKNGFIEIEKDSKIDVYMKKSGD